MKILIALVLSTLAYAKMNKPSLEKDKLTCTKRDLERRDCELVAGKLKVSLHHGKWRFADGITLAVHDLPTGDVDVQWKAVRLHVSGDRRLLEYSAWSPPAGEGEVQTLTWHVIEVSGTKPTVHVAEIVQRRNLIVEREPATVQKSPKLRFQLDPLEKHGLTFVKDKVDWHAGRRKGSI